VHLEKSGFRGIWWGANPHGVHLATGPDWMHLMLEGLGRHLLSYICTVLKKAGWHKSVFFVISLFFSILIIVFQVTTRKLTLTSPSLSAAQARFLPD
jgi:hypothetical protein